jgi:diguanylate cyclase (GGDEF)-like protein/PAS domain S-box-containing protein
LSDVRNVAPSRTEDELHALVTQLLETHRRIEHLAGDQVDAVLGPAGTPLLLAAAQARLRNSEAEQRRLAARLTATLESITDGFFTVDHQFRFTYLNRRAARMLGVEPARVLGRDLRKAWAIGAGAPFRDAFERALAQGEPASFEAIDDASGLWLTVRAYPSAEGLAVYLQDTTRQHHDHEQLELLQTAVERLNDIIIITRSDSEQGGPTIVYVNPAFERITGYDRDEVVGRSPRFLQGPETSRAELDRIRRAIEHREPVRTELVNYTRSGKPYWLEIDIAPLLDPDGRATHFVAVERDVTERKRAEIALERERRLQHAVTRIGAAVSARSGNDFFDRLAATTAEVLGAQVGAIARILPGNASLARTVAGVVDGLPMPVAEYPLADTPFARDMTSGQWIVSDDAAFIYPNDAQLRGITTPRAYIGQVLQSAGGGALGLLYVVYRQPVTDTAFVSSVLRILAAGAAAELERLETDSRIRELAYQDPVTGLPNRAWFMEQLQQTLTAGVSERHPVALLFLDLNRFKEINDSQGHYVGDRTLRLAAERFRGALREGEILARLGGDEFVVMASGTDRAAARGLGERLVAALAEPVSIEGRSFTLDVSIGVAIAPEHGDDPGTLLKHTDIAMYQAKGSDRRVRLFHPRMSEELDFRLSLSERLGDALDHDRLNLFFQPQVDLASGRFSGAEALLRWHDPQWGWISPEDFIPLAEERRMMHRVGDWVIRQVCRQLAEWRRGGLSLPPHVAINIAAQQLENMDIVRVLGTQIRAFDLEPALLQLELTETGIMNDPNRAEQVTGALRAAGFPLSIDDFGTGYSSLAYLKRFPVETLKIDRSFVRDMLSADSDYKIVSAIIAMARNLGMSTLAEGVETKEQAHALLALGCEHAQGYLYGRPLPADEFAGIWLGRGNSGENT